MSRLNRLLWTGLVLGVAACGDDVTVPPPPITVTVTPDGATISVGQTLQMAASASGGTGATFVWSSSDNAKATVSGTGLVTAVAAGDVGITATATVGSSTGAGSATVHIQPTTPQLPPTLSIASITNTVPGTGEVPVNLGAVAGQINVTVNLERNGNPIDSVILVMKNAAGQDTTVAKQSFTVASAPVDGSPALVPEALLMSINTAAFHPETGEVSFLNGANGISARAFVAGTTSGPAATHGINFTLANEDDVVITLATSNDTPQADDDGNFWFTGDLIATAVVVVYSGDNDVQQVVFDPDGGLTTVVDTEAPFTATWPKATAIGSGGSAGFEDDVEVEVNTAVGGNPGPSSDAELRLDNAAPTAGTLDLTAQDVDGAGVQTPCCDNNWVGPAYSFDAGYTAGSDAGVGGVTATFHVLSSSGSPDADEVVDGGEEVSTGADLGDETILNTDLTLAVSECDALENCVNTLKAGTGTNTGETIGHDKTAPVIAVGAGTVAANDINNAAPVLLPYNVSLTTENLSGIAASPLLALATGNFTTSDFDATTCFAPSLLVGDECFADLVPGLSTSVAAVDATNKYIEVVLVVWDRAGNASNQLVRLALHDNVAPTIDPFLPPAATLTGGATAAFAGNAEDNVDLESADLLIDGTIPVVAAQSLGTFGSPLTLTGAVAASAPWIRSINGVSTTSATLRAFDVAGNVGTQSAAVTSNGPPVAIGGTFTIESAAFTLCSTEADCDGNDSPTSDDVTIRIRGVTGTFANPFTNGGYVLLYFTDGNGNNHFIGKATAFATNDDNVNRDYIYTIAFNALGLDALKFAIADGTAIDLTAVGVTAAGDAVTVTSVGLVTIEH